MNIGDEVMFSAKFLRSTGQIMGEAPFAVGVITGLIPIEKLQLVTVAWPDGERKALSCNLFLRNRRHLEPA